jgi:hypothetical protein
MLAQQAVIGITGFMDSYFSPSRRDVQVRNTNRSGGTQNRSV